MKLREALLEEHSRKQADKIVQWIDRESERIRALLDILLRDEYRVVQRAARVVSLLADRHPDMISPYVPALIGCLKNVQAPAAVKRNVFRLLQYLELPEAQHGELLGYCLDAVADPKETAAVRAFGMSILERLAEVYPGLAQEVQLVIREALARETAPSFHARARKVLKNLDTSRKKASPR